MKKTQFHGQTYEFYSWERLGDDIFTLAEQIIQSGKQFDRIIALAKGGLTFSRSLVDYLQVDNVSTFQIEFYTGIGTTENTPVITQSLPVSIKGEKILIFDDIVDRGPTMTLATQYLLQHGATTLTTAALIQKPWSTFTVDFCARQSESWVIFPNEVRETITLLKKLWLQKGDSLEKIEAQLLEIGFGKEEVALFLKLE